MYGRYKVEKRNQTQLAYDIRFSGRWLLYICAEGEQKSGMKHKNCILVFFLTQMLHYSFASARHQ